MTRILIVAAGVIWVGATLLLAQFGWFSRISLTDRLAPYTPGGSELRRTDGLLSVESFRDVIAPLSRSLGERAARLMGVSEELSIRLARIHSPLDVTSFRVRQLGWCIAIFGAASLAVLALSIPSLFALLMILGGPVLAFLVLEQRLAAASNDWQQRTLLELPVVAEQLGMLLGAGYSLGSALNRVAERGNGAVSRDLERVSRRIRHGLSEAAALTEWSTIVGVDAVERPVGILALNREAGDLGRLISEEARSIRKQSQRSLIETIERRAEQVWIPVTVATLVPGVMFMAVPFISAMSLFA